MKKMILIALCVGQVAMMKAPGEGVEFNSGPQFFDENGSPTQRPTQSVNGRPRVDDGFLAKLGRQVWKFGESLSRRSSTQKPSGQRSSTAASQPTAQPVTDDVAGTLDSGGNLTLTETAAIRVDETPRINFAHRIRKHVARVSLKIVRAHINLLKELLRKIDRDLDVPLARSAADKLEIKANELTTRITALDRELGYSKIAPKSNTESGNQDQTFDQIRDTGGRVNLTGAEKGETIVVR